VHKGSFSFQIGSFNCFTLLDGLVDYQPGKFFSNVDQAMYEAVLRKHNLPTEYVRTPYTYLFIDTGQHRILVDMGAQKKGSTGNLTTSMREAGIEPESIEWVIITHAHPDHIGGALDDDGHPKFTNAHYYIWGREVRFWTDDKAFEMASSRHVELARTVIDALEVKLVLLEEPGQILPGINVVFAPGHTPGHMVVEVTSEGERLFYTADTVLSPLHLSHPDWKPVYDILPEEAAESKQRIFDMVSAENAWVIGQHFPPFPSLGHVAKLEPGWEWQPISVSSQFV
jgi:glyoxylase-like metal-dependent hydrolase (beta-lactamase superfamily II)